MSQLRRMLLSNVGYRSAYYAGTLLDFCNAETGQPENSVIWLANQGGKTTLISLLFTNIEPRISLFVQHLQKKDHRFADYFYRTPGVVALELQIGSADLTGATPVLVIGQCVVIQDNGQPQRLFFGYSANDQMTLDSLPFKGVNATEHSHSMAEFKQWLEEARERNSTIFTTEQQSKWKQWMDTMGVEHELLAKQIDFCRSEGGIADFASFKDERTFLEQFFLLALDAEMAEQAHVTLRGAHQQYKETPRLEEKQTIYVELAKGFQGIQPYAFQYQQLAKEVKQQKEQLMLGVQQIQLKQQWLIRERNILQNSAQDTEEKMKLNQQVLIEANQAFERTTLSLTIQQYLDATQKVEEETERQQEAQKQLDLLKAVIALDALRKVEIRYETIKNSINDANQDIKPKEEALKQTGSQLIATYQQVGRQLSEQYVSVQQQIIELDKRTAQQENEKNSYEQRRSDAKTILDRANQWLDSYTQQWKILEEKGHLTIDDITVDVMDAKRYWNAQYEQQSAKEKEIKFLKNKKQEEHESSLKHLTTISNAIIREEAELEQLTIKYDEVLDKRSQLEELPYLCQLIQMHRVNPDELSLLLKVNQSIIGLRDKVEKNRRRINKLNDQKEWLENDCLAKPDSTIEQALAWLDEQGIEASYYPHYLGKQQLVAAFTKELVESDPARFYGIQVNNLAKIRDKIDVIDREKLGLSHPVIISEGCTTVGRQHNNVVLPARNDAAYNEEAGKRLLHKINVELADLEQEQVLNQGSLDNAIIAQEQLKFYQAEYGSDWLEKQQQKIDSKQPIKLEKEQEQQTKQTELTAIQQMLEELSEVLTTVIDAGRKSKAHRNAIVDFIGSFESQKAPTMMKKDNAAIAIENAVKETEAINELIHTLRDEQKQCGKDEFRYQEQIQRNNDLLGKINHKNEVATLAAINIANLAELQAKYSVMVVTYEALMYDPELLSLQGQLSVVGESLTEKKENYLTMKAGYTDDEVNYEKQNLQHQSLKLSHLLEKQEKKCFQCFAAVSQCQKVQQDCNKKRDYYQRKNPDVVALEKKLSVLALQELLQEISLKTDKSNVEIKRLKKMEDQIEKKERLYRSQGDEITIALKSLADDSWGELPDDSDVSLAKAIQHRKVIDEIMELNKAKIGIKSQQEKIKSTIHRHFRNNISPIVEHSEKSKLIGAKANDFRYLSVDQLIKNSDKHMLTLQDILAAVETKIQINNDKMDFIYTSFNRLLNVADDALHAACRVHIPDDMLHYSKKSILKSRLLSKHKLQVTLSQEQRKSLYLQHLEDGVRKNAVDEDGYKLAAAFLLKAYELVLDARKVNHKNEPLAIRIIKPHDVEVEYIPVNKMVGSGGEGLTTGLLLYLVIANIRGTAMGKNSIGTKGSFLLLDNPFSKANKVDLIRPQTQLAKKLNIQLIFATGIEDLNAIGEFEHIIRLRKDRMDTRSKCQYIEHDKPDQNNEEREVGNFDKYRIQSVGYSYGHVGSNDETTP